jgi:high-affinity K+ transport system ATPase subunit B
MIAMTSFSCNESTMQEKGYSCNAAKAFSEKKKEATSDEVRISSFTLQFTVLLVHYSDTSVESLRKKQMSHRDVVQVSYYEILPI